MRKTILIFLLIFSVLCTMAQKNIFVLVDVSKSVKRYQLDNARSALSEIFTTGAVTNGTVVGGTPQDLQFYKLQAGDKVAVSVFGDLQTSASIIPLLKTVNNPNSDVDNILNSIVWQPRDNWTYLTLAKAKIAEFAKNRKINDYQLIEITDNVNDDYGPNGHPRYHGNSYLENLITQYNTTTNKVSDKGWTKIGFGSDTKFLLSLTAGVNISSYTPPTFQPTHNGITITYPSQTKKGAELEINDESFNLTWACVRCQPNLEYSVFVEGYDGNPYNEHIDTIKKESAALKLTQNGMYQIIVSANGCNLIPDTAFIKLNVVKNTKIQIMSPSKGTSQKPTEVKGEAVNVSWRCPDCDDNTTYSVTVSGIDGNNHKEKPLKIKGNSASFKLPDGKYKITVSGTEGASSDSTYIKVSSGGGAGFLIFLLLAALAVGIFFLIKNLKNKKPTPSSSSSNGNNNPSNNNSNNNIGGIDTADDGMF